MKVSSLFLANVLSFLKEKHIANRHDIFLELLLGVLDVIIDELRVGDGEGGNMTKKFSTSNAKSELVALNKRRRIMDGDHGNGWRNEMEKRFVFPLNNGERKKESLSGVNRIGEEASYDDGGPARGSRLSLLLIAFQGLLECFVQVCFILLLIVMTVDMVP